MERKNTIRDLCSQDIVNEAFSNIPVLRNIYQRFHSSIQKMNTNSQNLRKRIMKEFLNWHAENKFNMDSMSTIKFFRRPNESTAIEKDNSSFIKSGKNLKDGIHTMEGSIFFRINAEFQ